MSDQTFPRFDFVDQTDFPGACYSHARTELGLTHSTSTTYPCSLPDPSALEVEPDITEDNGEGNWRALFLAGNEMAAIVGVAYGNAHISVAATTPGMAKAYLAEIERVTPRHRPEAEDRVAVTFWSYTKEGPRGNRRDLEVPSWAEIGADNYAAATRRGLEPLMEPGYRPGRSGQLILWHGQPGTGKTTALRALAHEWKGWAEIHYITDPDQFFGSHADYMLEVMLGAGAVENVDDGKWRLLVLEDAGELLTKDAKSEVGSALSRFLNAVDGLIGQGLRVLTMVTTNEELGQLNAAVTRHGRAASEVNFEPLSVKESAVLLERLADADAADRMPAKEHILADIYALAEERFTDRPAQRSKVGFTA